MHIKSFEMSLKHNKKYIRELKKFENIAVSLKFENDQAVIRIDDKIIGVFETGSEIAYFITDLFPGVAENPGDYLIRIEELKCAA